MWYNLSVREQPTKLKARASKYDLAIFYWHFNGQSMGIMSTHVDDLVCWGGEECFVKTVIHPLRSVFLIGSECDTTFKYAGLCMTQQDDFSRKWIRSHTLRVHKTSSCF